MLESERLAEKRGKTVPAVVSSARVGIFDSDLDDEYACLKGVN